MVGGNKGCIVLNPSNLEGILGTRKCCLVTGSGNIHIITLVDKKQIHSDTEAKGQDSKSVITAP